MAKRFTDSDKWTKKPWFRTLKPEHKLFWLYLLDSCDQAGIWEVDFGLASLLIGMEVNEEEAKKVFKKQYQEIKDGRKWYIPDFITFQYGELNTASRMHGFVLNLLKKEGVFMGCQHPLDTPKDKDKDKVKEKEGGVGETKTGKPRLDDVKAAFGEKGFPAEAERFFDYYEANGWRVGRNPMKNWRAAVANWLRHAKTFKPGNVAVASRTEKPKADCTACGGKGRLPEGGKCWCWS